MAEDIIEIHPDVEEHDLVEIAQHIALDDPEAAIRVLNSIDSSLRLLAGQPESGTEYHPLRRSLQGIRMFPVPEFRNYLIYYRPLSSGAGIRVLHIIHAARDSAQLLKNRQRQ
jgi:toxin ParE1/3/4